LVFHSDEVPVKARIPSLAVGAVAVALAAFAGTASASSRAQYGVQDDVWLEIGTTKMWSIQERLETLDRLGVDVVRYTLRWDRVAPLRPTAPASPDDPAYDWSSADALLAGLQKHKIDVVLTLWGTPTWASGQTKRSHPPRSPSAFALFATAAARRYPWVHKWEIWNEPNQVGGLKPNSPRLYVERLLNPAVAALHAVNPRNIVAGGATSPRATRTALSAVAFMRGMRRAGARFDVYSHHPYPRWLGRGRPETPLQTLPCTRWLTMASLQCLLKNVTQNFGPKHVWLTEYAYKTNPPDRFRGVAPGLQARYLGEAARRVYQAPRVDLLINFLIRDEPVIGRWSSGFFTARDVVKPSFFAFMLPLAELGRQGGRTMLWGQVRPRSGPQPYLLQRSWRGRWLPVGGVSATGSRGFIGRQVFAAPGSKFRIWSLLDDTFSPALIVR
jgi:Cellulase (glycosyl hydrolase family 5)